MLDGYEEIFEMAHKLGLSPKPVWYDNNGCPRWQEPDKRIAQFVKPIRCQRCGQEFRVSLVDDVYHTYSRYLGIRGGTLPEHWAFGDPPSHPTSDKWAANWWNGGWDVYCTGVTMTSIAEWEFPEWNLEGNIPIYKDEKAVERSDD